MPLNISLLKTTYCTFALLSAFPSYAPFVIGCPTCVVFIHLAYIIPQFGSFQSRYYGYEDYTPLPYFTPVPVEMPRRKKFKTIPLSEICSLRPFPNPFEGLKDASPPNQQTFPSYAKAAGGLLAASTSKLAGIQHTSVTTKFESLDEASSRAENQPADCNRLEHGHAGHYEHSNTLPPRPQSPDNLGSAGRSGLRQEYDTDIDKDSHQSRDQGDLGGTSSGRHTQTPDTDYSQTKQQVQQQISQDDSAQIEGRRRPKKPLYPLYSARWLRCQTCALRHPASPGFPLDCLLTQVGQSPMTYTCRPCPVSRKPMVVYILCNGRTPLPHTEGGNMATYRYRNELSA